MPFRSGVIDRRSVRTITRRSFCSSAPFSESACPRSAGSSWKSASRYALDVALERCGLGVVVEEEAKRVDEIGVVVVLDILGDRVHLVRRRREQNDSRRLAAVIAESEQLLRELRPPVRPSEASA